MGGGQEDDRADMVHQLSTFLVSYLRRPTIAALDAFLGFNRMDKPNVNALDFFAGWKEVRHWICHVVAL